MTCHHAIPLSLALIAATAVAVPVSGAAQEILRVPYTADIGSFDPDDAFEVGGLSAINNVYEGLVEYVPGGTEITGLLAESWEISEDGTVYTFRLKPGVLFHDGTPADAAAVKASFERRMTGDVILGYFLWNVASIEAPDATTLVVTLNGPQPSFLDALASPWGPKAVSPAAMAEHDTGDGAKAWLVENAVGTGPFRLAEFVRGQRIVLERFEDYHGEAPFFDAVEIPIVPDVGQQILQLRSGEIDAIPANYPWEQLAALPPGLEVTASPGMSLLTGFVNPTGPLGNPAVREAVLTAIAPSGWVEDAFGGYASPALSLYPAAMLTPAQPIAFPTDLEAARAAIAAAGPVSLTVGYGTEEAPNVARAADLMIAELAGIGVAATVTVLPTGAVFALADDPASAPDLVLARQSPDAAHPENQAGVFYVTGAPLNLFGVSLPEADALAAEAGAMTDEAARDAAYEEAGRLWFEAGLFVPFADIQDVVVHAEGLADLGLRTPWPMGNIDFGTVRWAD
jgi:peptide/nickel transport system substrate-binding protein